MSLKIFHTSDIHLGMKFSGYPASVQEKLREARIEVLNTITEKANSADCDLLVVAGDLFNHNKVKAEIVLKAINIFDHFKGKALLFLPGNHDYDLGQDNVWRIFENNRTKRMILLNEFKPYDLEDYGLDVTIYPSPCDSKHSEDNNLDWIKKEQINNSTEYAIGIAHGALQGLSPDLKDKYFQMTATELLQLNMDIWLLGHSHLQYPADDKPDNKKIFNSGTPEPDGMDCDHEGYAWEITIKDEKDIVAEKIMTGKFRFYEYEQKIRDRQDFLNLPEKILKEQAENQIVRLKLTGGVAEEIYQQRQEIYDKLKYELGYLNVNDDDLYIKLSMEDIADKFTPGSFPHHFLEKLADDEKSLHLAYELIKEVQNEA